MKERAGNGDDRDAWRLLGRKRLIPECPEALWTARNRKGSPGEPGTAPQRRLGLSSLGACEKMS